MLFFLKKMRGSSAFEKLGSCDGAVCAVKNCPEAVCEWPYLFVALALGALRGIISSSDL